MKKIKILILVSFVLSVVFADKIAVATKVKGNVEIMRKSTSDYTTLKPGTILSDGDKLRTGKSGFAAVIFIDDKSTLKLKENSEAIITGQRTAASISKKINMDAGTVRATVTKQNSDFIIQTPTSVASVKGTDFWLITDPIAGDQIIGIEGLVGLVNTETGQEVDVSEGTTGVSTPDGQLGVDETDPNSVPDDPSDDSQDGPSSIRIYLEGPNGEQRVMIIDYQ